MPNEISEHLLAEAVAKGGLNQKQIAQIVMFRIFGNKNGFLHFENLRIGPIPATPISWNQLVKRDITSEKLLLQTTSLLGEPIGYTQESNGALINNFFPQQSQAKSATSDSYDTELDLHTENAFHAVQPEHLVLLCLRQDPLKEAVTYITSIDRILPHLTDDDISFFFTEPYNFLSDYSHTEKNCRIDVGQEQTVLYGDRAAPMFRFDPHFMVARSAQGQAQLEKLRAIAWDVAQPVLLKARDMLIIDNRKTAHARSPFTARFDGTDRWIQRAFAISNQRFYTAKLGKQSRVFDLVTAL